MISLSIIIPVFNVEQYLKKCLDSIFFNNNNLDLFEVIIVNDGTPDNSMEIVAEFTKIFKNIFVVNQVNKGLGEARNEGVKHVNGEYLWFVDSDDWLVEGAINNILNILNLNELDILAIDYTYSSGEKSTVMNFAKQGSIYTGKEYLAINFVQNPVQYYVINSSFYKKNNLCFKKGIYHEDSLFTPIALFYAKAVMFFNSSCYIYNVREGSIMTSPNATLKHCNDMITVSNDLLSFMITDAKNSQDKRILSKYIGTALGGVYYYWKTLNYNDKKNISNKLLFFKFFKPLILSFQYKYLISTIVIKLK
jgi:glycosyltransferase involved in cell wall biosynthesis